MMRYKICGAIIATCAIFSVIVWLMYSLLADKAICNGTEEGMLIYIDRDDTVDSVRTKSAMGWHWDVYTRFSNFRPRTGRYRVACGTTCLQLFRQLRNGIQEPVRLTIPPSRTMEKLAHTLSQQLMVDSAEIASMLTDSSFCMAYGYTTATIPALFIPNTYEVYWDTSVNKLIDRMQRENRKFWNAEREQKAKACHMTHEEIATLASIVDEETANNAEKPMIAGLYLNRLKKGMLLQADPTVKYAVGDFSLRRILNKHLQTESPYNTYKVCGLPPGPIRIASIAGLEAVLNYAEHKYLYMCAKEDFSGTHNFATTYSEHLRNARRYVNALNARGIK